MMTIDSVYSVFAPRFKPALACIILLLSMSTATALQANVDVLNGTIDTKLIKQDAKQSKADAKAVQKQVRKEQQVLEKTNAQALQQQAKRGERLAQVVTGSNFAAEAQMLTFAPPAANAANSDALRWYALAAKRGFPGAPSLDLSGVNFYPVRVVRNR